MKFKYVLTAALTASIGFGLAGCSKQEKTVSADNRDIKVVTLLTRDNPPYPQVAEYVREKVKKQNIELKIKYANDGLIPNKSVAENEVDLNYFQHKYGGRALNLLARAHLIELKPNTGAKTSLKDITANPKDFQFTEVEHALVPVSFKDADLAIMAGAYTVHANLLPKRDSIYLEQDNQEYDSVLVSNSKAAEKPEVQAVKDAFIAEDTREFVLKNYTDTVTWPKR